MKTLQNGPRSELKVMHLVTWHVEWVTHPFYHMKWWLLYVNIVGCCYNIVGVFGWDQLLSQQCILLCCWGYKLCVSWCLWLRRIVMMWTPYMLPWLCAAWTFFWYHLSQYCLFRWTQFRSLKSPRCCSQWRARFPLDQSICLQLLVLLWLCLHSLSMTFPGMILYNISKWANKKGTLNTYNKTCIDFQLLILPSS